MKKLNIDKEQLIKHRFWIGLGVFVPLWLIILLVLWTSVGGTVSAERTAYDKSLKDVKALGNFKNGKFVEPVCPVT